MGESKGRGVPGRLLPDRGGRFGSVDPRGGVTKDHSAFVWLSSLCLRQSELFLPIFGASLINFEIQILKGFKAVAEVRQGEQTHEGKNSGEMSAKCARERKSFQ